jgi:hypothetical protein
MIGPNGYEKRGAYLLLLHERMLKNPRARSTLTRGCHAIREIARDAGQRHAEA